MQATPTTAETTRRADRRNYYVFLFEGGFFVFGLGFVNVQSLLPALIIEEGGPSWVAAYMPTIMVIGMFSIPMLNAAWIDRLTQLRPFVILTGFFQRLVFLLVGLLLLYGGLKGDAVWMTLAAAPLLSGILGGLGFAAWQRLYMNSVPSKKRASNLAFRLLFGGITGIIAGSIIQDVLETYPGVRGYGILHLLAALFFMASWLMLFAVSEKPTPEPVAAPEERAEPAEAEKPKEPDDSEKVEKPGAMESFRSYYRKGPTRSSRLNFLWSLFLMHGFCLVVPFFAVTLLARLDQPKSFLGVLAMWQMGGQSVGNLIAAVIGDRWGGRVTFGIGLGALVVSMLPAIFVTDIFWAQICYAAFSMSMMIMIIGKDTLLMELSPIRNQSSYLARMALFTMLALVFYGGIAQLLWSSPWGFTALTVAAVVSAIVSCAFVLRVHDPRGVQLNPLRVIRRGILRLFR